MSPSTGGSGPSANVRGQRVVNASGARCTVLRASGMVFASDLDALSQQRHDGNTWMAAPAGRQSMTAQISDGVGRVVADFVGRGPTSVRTMILGDLVVSVMRETFTRAERTLVDEGQGEFVRDMRLRFQQAMREDLIAVVTDATGREVEAFLSDHHLHPDIAVETFILHPEPGAPNGTAER